MCEAMGVSDSARALQAATNRRLRARPRALVIAEDGIVGHKTLEAVRKVAWALAR
jgi:lysozyme family protein